MFERKLLVPVLGQLVAEGQSSVWEGELSLPFVEGESCFLLRLRGNHEGPTEAQILAVQNLIRNCIAIKIAATVPMFNLFEEGGFGIDPKEKPEVIWSYLTPGMIEVEKESKEWGGAVYSQIGFESHLCPSAFPCIGTLNGQFELVSVET